MRPCIISESWPVVGFYPHVTSTGVFGINLNTLYPNFGSSKGGVQRNEPGNRTIMLYHSHLAIEVYDFKFLAKPLVFGGSNLGRYTRLSRTRPTPRPKRKKSLRTWDLSNRDQSLTLSWQSVFGFLYWGARPEEPGHNRSSSPSATLADIAERKVPKHGSRATQHLTQDMIRSWCI